MALSKDERDALPESDFAVPSKRALPMHDEKHARMAWDMVERTKDLSDSERSEARKRILDRAHKLGMETGDWNKLKAMSMDVGFSAMSLAMPTADHPNKMPFSGFLVWLDEASDKPPHGSSGRKIVMTHAAGEKAIPTLLGMGVNFTERLDGHDPQKKVGIISEANIRNVDGRFGIFIDGFIYASDFPNAAARIRADKDVLGFSFEARDITLADPGAEILAIEDCVFTGAAILRKDKAAFATTSLAAQAEGSTQEIEDMTKEEIAALFADAMKPLAERLEKIEAQAKDAPKVMAKAHIESMVEPHAKALEACADGMEAAGIGGHPERGHVAIARKMAKNMRASAAMGQIPHVFRDHDFVSASGTETETAIKTAIEAAVKPLTEKFAAQDTIITDLKAQGFNAAGAPERKTAGAEAKILLDKFGLKAGADGKLTVEQVDTVLDAQKVSGIARIEAKLKLQAAGVLAPASV